MPRIDIHHLQELAERPTGKIQLGELVRRLIYATVGKEKPNLHFLAGESNGYAGWDGWVEVTYEENGSICRHRSVWELSTNRKFKSKFKSDFQSARTKNLPQGWSKSDTIYVGITLRSVTPNELAAIKENFNKNDRADWAGVALLAADDIVQWLEKIPSVEDWAAEEFQVGTGRFGRSLEHYFAAWSKQSTPAVTQQLLVAGRDLSPLVSAFRAQSRSVPTFLCDSTEEAIALIYCAVKTLSEADAQLVIASCLVVTDEAHADRLTYQPVSPLAMPTVILTPPASKHRNRLMQAGYRVLEVLARNDDSSNVLRFERASVQDFATALQKSMGFDPSEAEISARSVGSSVSIWHIRSLFTNSQQPTLPIWADGQQTDAVIAAVFAGAWYEDSTLDMTILTALAGMGEAQLSSDLQLYANCPTPLLQQIGASRLVVAPTAAFEFIQRRITRHHIDRLSIAVSSVFSGTSPAVEERWSRAPSALTPRNRKEEFSDGLRDGLAETLLRIAVFGTPLAQRGALQGYSSAQDYVDHLINQFDGLNSDPKILASLDKQLPVLIEAAPSVFLDALDVLIQGAPDGLSMMLADEEGIFGRSFHTGLLWGLEALAWSPELLPRVAQLLATLSRIDAGGHIINRPFNSLCEIFLPWNPGTSSDPQTRTQILCSIVERETEVGWKLLLALMPGKRSTCVPTHKPSWRNFGQVDRKSIKRSEVLEAYNLAVTLTLKVAGSDPGKLTDLVEHYSNLAAHQKSILESALKIASQASAEPEVLQRLWSRLHKLCRHHASFPDANWAMPKAELERLKAIADGFALKDPVLKHRWLFDEHFPDLGNHKHGHAERTTELHERRRAALAEVLAVKGWGGVNELLSTVNYRYVVGNQVGLLDCDDIEILDAMNAWQALDVPEWMAFRSASCSRVSIRGSTWTERLLDYGREHEWSSTSVAMALVDYPDDRNTYDIVQHLSENIRKEYWTRRFGYLRCANDDIAAFGNAVDEFIKYGRAVDLIDQNCNDLPKLGHEHVLRVIDSFIAQPPDAEKIRTLGSIQHDLQSVFDWLRQQPAVGTETLARREYALLPLLISYGFEKRDLALHELLRQQPEFFVDVVCDLYKPASTKRDLSEADIESAKARAHAAFELLESWRTPPGVEDGIVSIEKLSTWVESARWLLSIRDRAEIGDQTIGKLLYHLPEDRSDGAYPPHALRVLLERLRSDQLERGIEIESINSRGVYSKSIGEGGTQERELANRWLQNAKKIGPNWPKSKALCLRISETWNRHANSEDLEAQHDRAQRSR